MFLEAVVCKAWPRYCQKVYSTKMAQNGQNDHLGKMTLFSTGFWYSADQNGPKCFILIHFGLKRSILVHLGPPTVLWPLLCLSCLSSHAIPARRYLEDAYTHNHFQQEDNVCACLLHLITIARNCCLGIELSQDCQCLQKASQMRTKHI